MLKISGPMTIGFIEAFCFIPLLHWLIAVGHSSSVVINPILRTCYKCTAARHSPPDLQSGFYFYEMEKKPRRNTIFVADTNVIAIVI